MTRRVDDPRAFMPPHIDRKARGPFPYSLDGVLSLLDPEEAATLRLGELPLFVTLVNVVAQRRGRGWCRGTAVLREGVTVDEVRDLVELEIVWDGRGGRDIDPRGMVDPPEFWVESVRRLLFLEARLR